jgi:hypothetical protein
MDRFEEGVLWARIERKARQADAAEQLTDELRREHHVYAEAQAEIASRLNDEALALIAWYEDHRAA